MSLVSSCDEYKKLLQSIAKHLQKLQKTEVLINGCFFQTSLDLLNQRFNQTSVTKTAHQSIDEPLKTIFSETKSPDQSSLIVSNLYTQGITIRFNKVAESKPPKITTAIGL